MAWDFLLKKGGNLGGKWGIYDASWRKNFNKYYLISIISTNRPFLPNEARYQAAPHLDTSYINDIVRPMIIDFNLLDATTWRYASFFDCKMEIMD